MGTENIVSHGRRAGQRVCRYLLLVVSIGALFVPAISLAQNTDRGRILEISTDKNTVRRGDSLKISAKVQSLQTGEHHQLVVLNILDSNEKAIYDSHAVKEDIDFVMRYRQTRIVGPFTVTIPSNTRPGAYTVLVGYREYPWDPLIAFQGAKWCPPVKNIRVR